jgi:hypothetical protein
MEKFFSIIRCNWSQPVLKLLASRSRIKIDLFLNISSCIINPSG